MTAVPKPWLSLKSDHIYIFINLFYFQPKIAFNPATMLPGASPPKRVIEAAPTSLDEPPAVETLANPNKV